MVLVPINMEAGPVKSVHIGYHVVKWTGKEGKYFRLNEVVKNSYLREDTEGIGVVLDVFETIEIDELREGTGKAAPLHMLYLVQQTIGGIYRKE